MSVALYSQFGSSDTPARGLLGNHDASYVVDFVDDDDHLDHGVDQILEELCGRGLEPSEVAIDLLIVAATINAADTRILRRSSLDGWTREIALYIPVSQPALWIAAAEHLARMLKFLTGDYWSFNFRERPEDCAYLAYEPEEVEIETIDVVSLFSGGLDSFIGAIDLIASDQRPLFMSHYWDGEASAAQNALLVALREHFGEDSFDSIRARIGFDAAALATSGVEPTQRARSFLFYSMATVAADALPGDVDVVIPENGLIALNVPMEPLRLGALSTRTAHPFFITCMGELVQHIGLSPHFENPYRFKTKGEMVAECCDLVFLEATAPDSMSCSSPAKVRWHGAAPQHCGHCVPCLIRRAALHTGLSGKDETLYFLDDLKTGILDSKRAEGKDIRSFLFALKTLSQNPDSARFLVRKPGPLDPADIQAYADVYSRGMDEVATLLKGVKASH